MAIEYVLFSRLINDENVSELVRKLNEISSREQDIYLLLNSHGGNVAAGIHCYNMLRALPTRLVSHNVGNVDSIANAIFLAGEERYSTSAAVFMYHSVGFDFNAPTRLDCRQLREHLDSVVADHNRIGAIISDRSELALPAAIELFDTQIVRTSAWALESGIIHGVKDLQLPSDRILHEIA